MIIEGAQHIDHQLGRRLARLGAQKIVTGSRSNMAKNSYLSEIQNNIRFKVFELSDVYSKDSKIVQPSNQNHLLKPTLFRQALYEFISDYISPDRLELGVPLLGKFEIDLVIKGEDSNDAPIALIIDGWLKSMGEYDYELAVEKAETIKSAGYNIYPIWSLEWWQTPDKSIQNLIAFILK